MTGDFTHVSDVDEERSPAAILEEHAVTSIDRINKIDAWVRKVSFLLMGLVATAFITMIGIGLSVGYLIRQIDDSRWDSAVKSCQINRTSTHDSLEALMRSLSKTEAEKQKSTKLADDFFPADIDSCEQYARDLGLEP
jgi:hypothetical protein